jgi:hypothetical protein
MFSGRPSSRKRRKIYGKAPARREVKRGHDFLDVCGE